MPVTDRLIISTKRYNGRVFVVSGEKLYLFLVCPGSTPMIQNLDPHRPGNRAEVEILL